MIGLFISLPPIVRILCVVILSIAVARFINWAIYTWAFTPTGIGPWNIKEVQEPKRPKGSKRSKGSKASGPSWLDHLPIVGWYRLRRESAKHGKWFWIRPLLIEVLFPIAVACYYHYYVHGLTLQIGQAAKALSPELHWQFVGHFILFTLMAIATFIDFDEQMIPDFVTVPGTIIGLLGAAFAPAWLPFHLGPIPIELHAETPNDWNPIWSGRIGLAIALAIVFLWGFALLDRRIILRRGLVNAVRYFFARMFRHKQYWLPVVLITCALSLFVYGCWYFQIARWPYLFSSLIGLAFAGGVTWGVRISASHGLGVEALGFGDVTLMAMIGSYIGWQPSLLVFFIAPLVAILFVIVRYLVTGDSATPYGPYLCAAAVLVLVYWDRVWTGWAAPVFALGGGLILAIVVVCVLLMGVLLWIWRLIKIGLGIAGH